MQLYAALMQIPGMDAPELTWQDQIAVNWEGMGFMRYPLAFCLALGTVVLIIKFITLTAKAAKTKSKSKKRTRRGRASADNLELGTDKLYFKIGEVAEIVEAVIWMSHSIGLKVVAEGVELPTQLTRLKRMCWFFLKSLC